jgi:gliding motility-associated lipoprotein GldH
MTRSFRILLISALFLLQGCNKNRVYDKITDLNNRNWPENQVVKFRFKIDNTAPEYVISYNVRNSILYKYYNLYLSSSLEDTLGNVIESKLSNYTLFNPKTGEPLGSGLGDLFDHKFPVIEKYRFNNPGVYVFNVKQYMREDTLREIISIGLVIEKKVKPE